MNHQSYIQIKKYFMNSTVSSKTFNEPRRSEPDTLCFNGYSSVVLQGFKPIFRPPIQRPLIATLPPLYCPSGEDLGEESGETFVCAHFQLHFHWPRSKTGTVRTEEHTSELQS